MDLADSATAVDLIAGLLIVLGVLGVLLPVLPGLLVAWAGVLLWALLGDAAPAVKWLVLALATVVAVAGTVIKYLWPGRRLKQTGVPTSALAAGGALGLVGFFVVPVVGLLLGFVLGVWLVERARVGPQAAWPATRQVLAAAGLSMLVEFTAALGVATVWVFGLLAG